MNLPYEREEKKISNDELITTGREILLKEAASLEAAAGRLGDEAGQFVQQRQASAAQPLDLASLAPAGGCWVLLQVER